MREADEIKFDLGEMSIVKVDRKLPNPHATKKIVYQAKLKGSDLSKVFASGASQVVEVEDPETARITVRQIRPDMPKKLPGKDEAPTDADLKPNSLIQSDDPRIRALAEGVKLSDDQPWQVAKALESLVHQTITEVNFTQAFATAAEVAESREGDCTEHAVLLAALCRARKIPARVAIGLVYFGRDDPGFAYHMWTEVWISDRWVPLDATLARGGIGAAHLKLATSSLKGASAYSAFLPVVQVLGQLKLRLEEVD